MSAKVFAALIKAKPNFLPIRKDRKNPHLGNYYATLDSILAAVDGPLAEQGLAIIFRVTDDGSAVEAVLIHESGESYSSGPHKMILGKQTMQEVGSAETYAKRYSAGAVLGIVADEDDDGNAASGTKPRTTVKAPPRPATAPPTTPPATVAEPKAATNKPAPTREDIIAACKTPAALIKQLQAWKTAKPVGDDIPGWTKAYMAVQQHAAKQMHAGLKGWDEAGTALLHETLDSIAAQMETSKQADELFGKTMSATEGGL